MLTLDSTSPISKTPIKTIPIRETSTLSRVSPGLASVAYPLMRHLVLPLYFRDIEVIGQENVPLEGPVILAPTHRSRWDAILVPYATGRYITGRDLRFMVTADEMKGIQGWFIERLGGFAVNQKQPAIATLRHGVELLLRQEMLVIFPEGNIFHDNQVHRLKPGLARLAVQAESNYLNLGVKIVPISIHYHPIRPRWGSRVQIRIGCPLAVADYCHNNPKKDAHHLIQDLEIALKNIDQQ